VTERTSEEIGCVHGVHNVILLSYSSAWRLCTNALRWWKYYGEMPVFKINVASTMCSAFLQGVSIYIPNRVYLLYSYSLSIRNYSDKE